MLTVGILILLAVFVGACAQRITGMGFALVVSPFMVLLLGPLSGVMVVNLCGMFSSTLVLSRVWKSIDWRTFAWLVSFAVLGIALGSSVVTRVDPMTMEIVVGALLVVALTASVLASRFVPAATPNAPAKMATGFASGAMNAAAGVAGPALSVYALATRWEQRSFVGTMQPYLLLVSGMSFSGKLLLEPGSWPSLPLWMWVGIAVVLPSGVLAGERLSRSISPLTARRILVAVAYIGSVVTLIKGLMAFSA